MTVQNRKEQIQQMLQDDPSDPFLRYGLAMEFVSEGNDAEAIRQFRVLLAENPDYVPAYQQTGQALLRSDRADEARTILEQGILFARKQGNQHAADEMQGFIDSLQ